MGIYNNGTFRVGGQSTKNFNFNSNNKQHFYKTAKQMWDDQIDWGIIKQRVSSNIANDTSQAQARQIKELLLKLDEALRTGNNGQFASEELDMLKERIAAAQLRGTNGVKVLSLLSYDARNAKWAGAVGLSFENRINDLIQSIVNSNTDYRTGGSKFRVTSPIEFKLSNIATENQISSLKLTSKGKLSNKSRDTLWDLIKTATNGDYKNLIGQCQYEIQQKMGIVTDVIVRQVSVDRKIDIDLDSVEKIQSEEGSAIVELRNLLAGHTFSLKNYNYFTSDSPSVHIGQANEFRRMSSFYYFSTNSTNFADICTFIFASKNSKSEMVKRYTSWVRILYELMGAGQLWNGSTGRLVDYIIINFYNKPGPEGLIINSTKTYLEGMPKKDPNIFFNSDGTFKAVQY